MAMLTDHEQLAYGIEQLIKLDPRFASICEQSGLLPMRKLQTGFEGLANIIVGQMISRASADAIWHRMQLAMTGITSEAYLRIDEQAARGFGLSGAKHRTLCNLAQQIAANEIDLDGLSSLHGDEAHARLIALKGIGPWTADVYLLFALGHPDVFPVGDVALQAAAQHAFALEQRPNEKQLRVLSQDWRPWRSIAARLLWAYYSKVLKRSVTPLP